MKWWEYLMFWRWLSAWFKNRKTQRLKEAAVESDFQQLLHEAEERRGDLHEAVRTLRADRERRQAASLTPLPRDPHHQQG